MPKLQRHVSTGTDSISVSDSHGVICVQTNQPHGNTEDFLIDLTLLSDSNTDSNMPSLTDSSEENSSDSETDSEMSELATDKEDSDFQDSDEKNSGAPPLPMLIWTQSDLETTVKI